MRTDEQLRADVPVAQAGRRQPHHLEFLRGESCAAALVGGEATLSPVARNSARARSAHDAHRSRRTLATPRAAVPGRRIGDAPDAAIRRKAVRCAPSPSTGSPRRTAGSPTGSDLRPRPRVRAERGSDAGSPARRGCFGRRPQLVPPPSSSPRAPARHCAPRPLPTRAAQVGPGRVTAHLTGSAVEPVERLGVPPYPGRAPPPPARPAPRWTTPFRSTTYRLARQRHASFLVTRSSR